MRQLLIASLTILLLSACQSSSVIVDYDTETDFSHFRYYDWLTEDSSAEKDFDPLIAQRSKNAITTELRNAGFVPASETHAADLLVRYYVATHTSSQQSKSSGSIGMGSAGGNKAMGLSLSFPLGGSSTMKEAKIIIDFINPSDKKLKWRGADLFKISEESPEEITAVIDEVVAEIFSFYPPGAKQ